MRSTDVSDIRESIRQARLGRSNRQIGEAVGLDHKTVGRLREWAETHGWLAPTGELPDAETLDREWRATWGKLPEQNFSPLRAFEKEIRKLRGQGLSKQVVFREVSKLTGFASSYSALCHFIRQVEDSGDDVTVRVETAPGEEAQVDFGSTGLMYDTQTRKARKSWSFVMTLSWSRHQYVEFVFDQKVGTWLRAHQNAFQAFGGVPARVRIDNLKTAILRACSDDPEVQRAYREFAEHWGFIITPCRIKTPQHKGKVERGVAYVQGNFLAGQDYTQQHNGVTQANIDVKQWVIKVAGQRIHGTTFQRPLLRFEQTEQAVLQALPARPYENPQWTTLKLQRDCYLVFDKAFYSAPYRLVGETLAVRATLDTVQIYDASHALVATHTRATEPGKRATNTAHLPPHKSTGVAIELLSASVQELQTRAAGMGTAVTAIVEAILQDRVVDKRRVILRLLGLAGRYSQVALEQACQNAIDSGDPSPVSVRNWMKIGQSKEAARVQASGLGQAISSTGPVSWPVFARTAEELLPALAWTQTLHLSAETATCIEVPPCP